MVVTCQAIPLRLLPILADKVDRQANRGKETRAEQAEDDPHVEPRLLQRLDAGHDWIAASILDDLSRRR